MDIPLEDLVQWWLNLDRNPVTRNEIEGLWEAKDEPELERRLRHRIEFGTAGLRARMEAGFSRMNDVTVIQASQGLCAYVCKMVGNAKTRGILIGYDHRRNSERFAHLTAAAFIHEGVKVYLHQRIVHTPLVPFSVSRLRTACGVMITASHNPKDDNGYKVYWENAVQIIAPHDAGIASAIEQNLTINTWETSRLRESPLCIEIDSLMNAAYFKDLSSISVSMTTNPSSKIRFVNTSMHGVGHVFVEEAWRTFGFQPFTPCAIQKDPNPDFPTVKFPNPEEKGALELAIQEADSVGAQYVLAQDPDADRFTAAQKLYKLLALLDRDFFIHPIVGRMDGSWKQFSGDQIGTLLAAWTLECYKRQGKTFGKLAIVASTVSSKMLEAMAKVEGFKFVESLTGFKYIGNTALDLVREGYSVPFGYEEAIGYMLDTGIRDKDGVAATVFFAEMAAWLDSQGSSSAVFLDQLYEKYGYFETSNSYFFCSEPALIDRIFDRLRNWTPGSYPSYPADIAGLRITRVRDLTLGHARDSGNPPSFDPDLPLSAGHMITFRGEGNDEPDPIRIVLTIRTSGTEPKIKYYLEATGSNRQRVQTSLSRVVDELSINWMEVKKNGIRRP